MGVGGQTEGQYGNLAEYAVFARAPTVAYACTGLQGAATDQCLKVRPLASDTVATVATVATVDLP